MEERGTPTTVSSIPRSDSSSTPNDAIGRPEDEFLAVIVSIFDHCGLLLENGKDPSGLRQSLLDLSSKVQQFNRNSDDPWMNDGSKMDIASALLLYDHSCHDNRDRMNNVEELEQCLLHVRANAFVFVQTTLPNERRAIIAWRDEILDLYSSSRADRCCSRQWCILLQTIIAQFMDQLHWEESMIYRKFYPLLDSLYQTNVGAITTSLQQIMYGLSRASFLAFIPYVQAVEQLEKNMNDSLDRMTWHIDRQLPRIKSASLTSSDADIVAIDQTSVLIKTETLDRIKTNASIPSAVLVELISFLNSLGIAKRPSCDRIVGKIRALLLVGSPGSGKTFVCDEVERSARSLQDASLFGMSDTAYIFCNN
jgi:hypothetical protein